MNKYISFNTLYFFLRIVYRAVKYGRITVGHTRVIIKVGLII